MDVDDGPGRIHSGLAGRVWGIEEEKAFLAVVELQAAGPVEVFDGDAVEPEVEEPDGLQPGAAGSAGCPTLRRGAKCPEVRPTETVFIPEKPPRRFLDIREAGLVGKIEELATAVEDKFEFGEEGVGVEPDAPVECDEVAVDVVEDFEPGRIFCEENREAAGEWLDVAGVLADSWQDILEEP